MVHYCELASQGKNVMKSKFALDKEIGIGILI
jgi:hypothetical protein